MRSHPGQLEAALSQIAEIRDGVARGGLFRGFRAGTVAFSGAAAIIVALVQPRIVPDPPRQFAAWFALWTATAAVCLGAAALELALRCRSSPSAGPATRRIVAQFLPCMVAGALVTLALTRLGPSSCELLPGVWAVLFGLGIFAIRPQLPRGAGWVGAFYLLAGTVVLARLGGAALSPWTMGGVFGPGQLAAAWVLHAARRRPPEVDHGSH